MVIVQMHDSSLRASATIAYTRAAMQDPEKLSAAPRCSANRKRDKRAARKKTGRKASLILALRPDQVVSTRASSETACSTLIH